MKYFTIAELSRSSAAAQRGLDNTPDPTAVANLVALVDNLLDPLREAWGGPIIVNSGYRSAAVNRAVGGVATSSHLTGRAADITVGSTTANALLYQMAQERKLPFFELIGRKYSFKWLHISYDPTRPQRQPC